MKMYRRWIALGLMIGMAVTAAPRTAYAAEISTGMGNEAAEMPAGLESGAAVMQTGPENETAAGVENGEIFDVEEDVKREVILEYRYLETEVELTGNTDDAEKFLFVPEKSGLYYLTIRTEDDKPIDISYCKGLETDARYHLMSGLPKTHLMYLNQGEIYNFVLHHWYSGTEKTNYSIRMSDSVEITDITADGPSQSSYETLNFQGMKLHFLMSDGEVITSEVETYCYPTYSHMSIPALDWIDLPRRQTMDGNEDNVYYWTNRWPSYYTNADYSSMIAIDGNTGVSLKELADGVHTAVLPIGFSESASGETKGDFSVSFDFQVEKNAIDSIEIISKEQVAFTEGFGEHLQPVTLRVHYKDGRVSEEMHSSEVLEIKQGISYQSGDSSSSTEYIDTYLKNGGEMGQTDVAVSYRGHTAVYPITIAESPYEKIEIVPKRKVYYTDCGFTHQGSSYSGDYLSYHNDGIEKIVLYYKDKTKQPNEYTSVYDLPEYGKVSITYNLVLAGASETEQPRLYSSVDDYIRAGGATGKTVARFAFCGISADVEVEIKTKEVDHIEVRKQPDRTKYYSNYNGSLSMDGLVVRAYADADETSWVDYNYSESVSNTYMNTNYDEYCYFAQAFHFMLDGHNWFDALEPGNYDIHIYLNGKETTVPIQVVDSLITDFKVTAPDGRNDIYMKNRIDRFSPYGLILSFNDDEGAHRFTVYSEEYYRYCEKYGGYLDYTLPNVGEEGEYDVTIGFLGEEVKYPIYVADKLIRDMRVVSQPTSVFSYAGVWEQRLDGLELEVTELDGTVSKYRYETYGLTGYGDWWDLAGSDYYDLDTSAVDRETPGDYTISLFYKGVSVDLTVKIAENPVESIEILKAPTKTEYYLCEWQDYALNNMEYKINFKDQTSYAGTISDNEEGYANSGTSVPYGNRWYWLGVKGWKYYTDNHMQPTLGDNAIIVSYMGVEEEIPVTITVKEDPVASVECIMNPDKMSYSPVEEYHGVSANLNGAHFLITYQDGTQYTLKCTTAYSNRYKVQDGTYGGYLNAWIQYDYTNGKRMPYIECRYYNESCRIDLEAFDLAEHQTAELTDGMLLSVSIDSAEPYRIYAFTPEETKEYHLTSIEVRANIDFAAVYDSAGMRIYGGYYFEERFSAPLQAGETYYYYISNSNNESGNGRFYFSSDDGEFQFTADMIKDFEVTAFPKTKRYDFEDVISAATIDLFGLEYKITYTDGVEAAGTIEESVALAEEDAYTLCGLPLQVRWAEKEYDENTKGYLVSQSDTNKLIVSYAGKESELPVSFGNPTPVSAIEVKNNPWITKKIYQYNAADALNHKENLCLVIRYSDGREEETLTFTKSENYETWNGYPMQFANPEFTYGEDGNIKTGSYEFELTYMGTTVKLPFEVLHTSVSGIEVTKQPDKMTYYTSDRYPDLYGMELNVEYEDGSKKEIKITEHGAHILAEDDYAVNGTLHLEEKYLEIEFMNAKQRLDIRKGSMADIEKDILSPDQETAVSLDNITTYRLFAFVPEETGVYDLRCYGDDAYACLYDADENLLVCDENRDELNFTISRKLEQENTYYYLVRKKNEGVTGTITCMLEKHNVIKRVSLEIAAPTGGDPLETADSILRRNGEKMSGYGIQSVIWLPYQEYAEYGKAYMLTLTLRPNAGNIFSAAVLPQINGKTVVKKTLNSNGTMTLNCQFPRTDFKVTLPEAEGYTLDTSGNEKESGLVSYHGNYSFSYRKNEGNTDEGTLIVKANGNVIMPDENGVYTIFDVTENYTVTVRNSDYEPGENEAKLSLYDRETLYDVMTAGIHSTVAQNEAENVLPTLESYTDGSNLFFFGWYTEKNDESNGAGKRFKSTTEIEMPAYDLFAKWGRGIFSYLYKGLYANYKILSIDEDNRLRVQLGDGNTPAAGIPVVTAGELKAAAADVPVWEIPAELDLDAINLSEELGIELNGANVVAIGANAFSGNTELTSVKLPDTVTSIGAGAFRGCENLTEITLPESIEEIEDGTFGGCVSLKAVTVPEGVTSIGSGAFGGCSSLTTVVLPDTIETIADDAFDRTAAGDGQGLKIVCSPAVAESDALAAVKEETGVEIKTVELGFSDYVYGDKSFAMDDAHRPLVVTPMVKINGEIQETEIAYTVTEGYETYFDIVRETDGRIVIIPKKVTEEDVVLTIMAEGRSAALILKTTGLSIGDEGSGSSSRFVIDAIPAVSYSGKAQKPTVIVRDSRKGTVLTEGVDYTVSYANNKNAGTADVSVTGIGNYSGNLHTGFTIKKADKKIQVKKASVQKAYGSKKFQLGVSIAKGEPLIYTSSKKSVATVGKTSGKVTVKGIGKTTITIQSAESENYRAAKSVKMTITVTPEKTSISSVSSQRAGTITVKWKKVKKASGYTILCATNRKFKGAKRITVKSGKTVSKTIKGLKSGKTYYVKVCAYTKTADGKISGDYSKIKQQRVTVGY